MGSRLPNKGPSARDRQRRNRRGAISETIAAAYLIVRLSYLGATVQDATRGNRHHRSQGSADWLRRSQAPSNAG